MSASAITHIEDQKIAPKELWQLEDKLEDELEDEEHDCSAKEMQLQWQDGEDAKGRHLCELSRRGTEHVLIVVSAACNLLTQYDVTYYLAQVIRRTGR